MKKIYRTTLSRIYEKRYYTEIRRMIRPLVKGSKDFLKSDIYKSIRITDSKALTIEEELEKLLDVALLNIRDLSIIERLIRQMFITNYKKFFKAIEVDYKNIFLTQQDEDLITDTLIAQQGLIKSLMIDYKGKVVRILRDGYLNGISYKTLAEEIQKAINTSYFRAETIAISEMAKLNERINRGQFEKFGITKVRWSTAKDDRVRPCHKAREGKEFELKKGCYSKCDGKFLRVGQEVRCRCAYLIVINDIKKEGVKQ